VGIAVWGAILVGSGAAQVSEAAAGTAAANGERPRELVEAASSGYLDQTLATLPPQTQQVAADAAGEGFLAGLNDVLTLGALLSFAGAVLALWLVREREIEREPKEPRQTPEPETYTPLAPVAVRGEGVSGDEP